MNDTSRSIEFLVIGGGPAGAAIAFALAQRGREVVVVERSDYSSPRIGETLPSSAKPVLERMGLHAGSAQFSRLLCPGSVSIWGSDAPYFNDSLFDPYGCGMHVERASFDRAVIHRAEAAGATILREAEVRRCRRAGAGWDVTLSVEGVSRYLHPEFLIDAAGRRPWPGRLGSRLAFDRQVGMVKLFNLEKGSVAHGDHRTWIEATPNGWWYSSAVPGDRFVAAYFTDSDLLQGWRQRSEERWTELLQQATFTNDRLKLARPFGAARVVSASSTISRPVVGCAYIAVGDAASTIDPLSSHGILRALASGIDAAEALLATNSERARSHYARMIADQFYDDLRTRRQFCLAERRWPKSQFWHRRWVEPLPLDRTRTITSVS